MTHGRIWQIDMARSLALLGMAAFHLVFDLQFFGLVPPGTSTSGVFYWHARIVAGSFLFLAGLALWLGHGQGIRWPAFAARLARVLGAAALVTVATYIAMPDWFVFFGILHCIAAASLLGLLFLRLPWLVICASGAAVMAASYWLPELVQLNTPALRWLGLHTVPTPSVDFEPLVPWFGPFLLGLGVAKALHPVWPRLAARPAPRNRLLRTLCWPGRHSLAIYLLHQPVLMGLVWLWVSLRGL